MFVWIDMLLLISRLLLLADIDFSTSKSIFQKFIINAVRLLFIMMMRNCITSILTYKD